MTAKRLTAKQRLFALYYVKTLNGTRAAKLAGYSHKTAHNQAHKNLYHPQVLKEIERQFKKRSKMTDEEIIARLESQASADIAELFHPGTFEVDPAKVAEMGHLIEALWRTKEGVRVTLHNPQKALELLGKTRALFVERQIMELLGGLEIVDDEEAEDQDTAKSPGAAAD